MEIKRFGNIEGKTIMLLHGNLCAGGSLRI